MERVASGRDTPHLMRPQGSTRTRNNLLSNDEESIVTTVTITEQNFDEEVTNADTPVIVDLWAPWCGPCKALGPVLDKLAEEYEGQVKVGKINIDEEPGLAQAFNARSIPLVVAMKGDEVQDVVMGFRGEPPIRELFEKAVKA